MHAIALAPHRGLRTDASYACSITRCVIDVCDATGVGVPIQVSVRDGGGTIPFSGATNDDIV